MIQCKKGGDGDEKASIDSAATSGYLGAASNDGILRSGNSLLYTDGGDYITLDAIQDIRETATPTFKDLILTDFAGGNETIDEILDNTINRGILDTITVTDEGGLNITWTVGKIWDVANLTVVETDAQATPTAVTNNAANYLKWSSGTGLTLDTNVPVYPEVWVARICAQDGDIVGIIHAGDLNRLLSDMSIALGSSLPVVVVSGMVIEEDTDVTNALDVKMSTGVFWVAMQIQFSPSEILSRNTNLVRHFHASGAWDSDTDAEIDTANYDNGTDKTAIPSNKWCKGVFYYSNLKINWIYPDTYYNTQAQAIQAPLPTIPPGLTKCVPLMALVFQEGDTALPTAGGEQWIDIRPQLGATALGTVTDHGGLAGLGDDDHTQYALLAGRSGGQTLIGGTGSGDDLTLQSTSHATKGDILINNDTAILGAGGATVTLTFDGATNDGILLWLVAGDTFIIYDDLVFDSAKALSFRDSGLTKIWSNNSGDMDFLAGTQYNFDASSLNLKSNGTAMELRIYDSDISNYVGFEAPALSGNQIWVLPDADGLQSGSPLVTNASGTLSWGGNLDIGASTFTVNSIEIVGSDGEVNKAAVEDSGNWDSAYTHVSSDGTDHGYIDQDVQTTATPTFAGVNLGNATDNIQVASANPKKSIFLAATAMWASTTNGCADITKTELGTNDVDIQTLDFDQTTQEYAQFSLIMPDNWDAGTITFKVMWTAASGSGGVAWDLQGTSYADSDALDASWGSVQTVTDTLITANDLHETSESSAITLAGTPAAGEYVHMRISRQIGHASDTLTADAKLLGVRIEYVISQYNH